ncbi:MAG: hypothetical protein ACOCVM_01155 [Desulfovibrionaceae bacterium]
MRVRYLILLALAAVLAAPGLAEAGSVVGTGSGPSRDAAIQNALRNALEHSAGAYIHSRTQVNNFQVVMDSVTSSTGAYIRGYDVLAEEKDPIDGSHKVTVQAEVDDHKMKSAVEEFLSDPRFQKTFQKTAFDQRRVLVLYNRRTVDDLDYYTKGVQTLLDRIQDKLAGYGFRVFLLDELGRIKQNLTDRMIDENQAIQLARAEKADAVVLAAIDAGSRKTEDGFLLVQAAVSLQGYDPTTGELFANVQERGKTLAHANEYSLDDGVARVAIDTGSEAAEALTRKIVERFSTSREAFVVMIFTEVPKNVQDRVELLLRRLGWRYRVNTQQGRFLEVEVFEAMSPTDLRWEFAKAAEREGLPVTAQSIKGARLVFTGK